MTKLTLVSAFFRLPDRPVDEDKLFLDFYRLTECGLPILLFLDEKLTDRAPGLSNVKVVLRKLERLWPFQWAEGRALELPANRTIEKDTRDCLLLMNAKLTFLEMAFELDSESTHFAWIDFGVMKIVKQPTSFFDRLSRLNLPIPCVRTPGCWDRFDRSDNHSVNWRFCGGFMLIDRNSIPRIAHLGRVVFGRQRHLTWEVNVWADMERAGQEFGWYPASHDDSLVQ